MSMNVLADLKESVCVCVSEAACCIHLHCVYRNLLHLLTTMNSKVDPLKNWNRSILVTVALKLY